MTAKLRFFLAGAATTVAIIAAGFSGSALFASSASKQVRPARIEHQASAPTPAARVAPITSEPITATPVVAVEFAERKAQQSQLLPQAQPEVQKEERPRTRRELREERQKLVREERRAERRERRHHRKASQQQEANGDGEIGLNRAPRSNAAMSSDSSK
jgi:hypothetical protein